MGSSKERDVNVGRWKKVWDEDAEKVSDGCWLMVAGLKVICQPLDLVEGHILEGMEPHPINAEVVQTGNRQFRIKQQALKVVVNWLVHDGSYVEGLIYRKNETKDRFTAQLKVTQVEKLKKNTKAIEGKSGQ